MADDERMVLITRILEIAQIENDKGDEGDVLMPDVEEWGEIVGYAKRIADAYVCVRFPCDSN